MVRYRTRGEDVCQPEALQQRRDIGTFQAPAHREGLQEPIEIRREGVFGRNRCAIDRKTVVAADELGARNLQLPAAGRFQFRGVPWVCRDRRFAFGPLK